MLRKKLNARVGALRDRLRGDKRGCRVRRGDHRQRQADGRPTHANSICVFSGQNDDPTAPLSLDRTIAPNGPGGKSQSFGQDVKLGLDPHVVNPGSACGPGTNPDRQK